MSGGVPSALSSGVVKAPPKTATSSPNTSTTASAVPAMARALATSRAPQAWPISTEAPAPRPMMKAMKKNSSGKKPETAASAFTPIIWPR